MRSLMLSAFAIALPMTHAGGQQSVIIVDRGPGPSGRILADALAHPHTLVEPDTGWFVLPRTARESTTVIVLGRTAAIEGQVNGDVIVVGGDLFVRPRARIAGRAIAIGGGVYPSTLALVNGGIRAFRDNTFTIARTTAGYELSYRSLYADASPPVTLPGVYGLRIPSYDRANGLSVPFGPSLTFARGRGTAEFLATYRSHLGRIDPSARASFSFTPRVRLQASAARGTFSNERWIWPDYLNSISVLALGQDTRNHFRADRADLTVHRSWEGAAFVFEPFLGVRIERSWAVGPAAGETQSPWSLFNRTDTLDGMLRPNPAVPLLDLLSALAGASARWEADAIRATATLGAERGHDLDDLKLRNGFTQLTTDLYITFPTFAGQSYEFDAHWVTTPEGPAPPQRFAYIGGAGTLVFLDLLEQGGDELLLIDQRYSVPVPRLTLGVLGSPTVQLRHRMGSAGIDALPELEQVLGVSIVVSVLRVELNMDPATSRTRISAGLSVAR